MSAAGGREVTNMNPVADLTDYELSHLVAHLAQSGRHKDLDRLLSLETTDHNNAWYGAKDRRGDSGGYLSDVLLAWGLANAQNDDLSSDPTQNKVGRQCRYALMIASVNSLVKHIPAPLFVELVAQEIWSPEQGFAYARQINDPIERTWALTGLLSFLSTAMARQAFMEILDALRIYDSEAALYRDMTRLVPHVPVQLLPEAWRFALALPVQPGVDHARMLAAFVPFMPDNERAPIVKAAVVATKQIGYDQDRESVMQRLSLYISASPDIQSSEAIACAELTEDELLEDRVSALLDHESELEGALKTRLIRTACTLAQSIQAVEKRVHVLGQLSLHLEGPLLDSIAEKINEHTTSPAMTEAVIQQLLRALFWEDRPRVLRAVSAIASHLPEPLRSEIFRSAMDVARESEQVLSRVEQLLELLPSLPEQLRQAAVEEIFTYMQEAPSNLVELVKRSSPKFLGGSLRDATRDIKKWILSYVRFATYLPSSTQQEIMDKALALAMSVGDDVYRPDFVDMPIRDRAPILVKMAAYLPEPQKANAVNEALAEIRHMEGKLARSDTIAKVAPHLPKEYLRDALNIAQMIEDDPKPTLAVLYSYADALGSLPEPQKREMIQELFISVLAAANQQVRDPLIAALTPQLTWQLLEEGIQIDPGKLRDNKTTYEALLALAQKTEAPLQEVFLQNALVVVAGMGTDTSSMAAVASRDHFLHEKIRALGQLAAYLPDSLLPLTLKVVEEMPYGRRQAEALIELAPYLTEQLLLDAVDLCCSFPNRHLCVDTIIHLATHVPESIKDQILDEAVKVARQIEEAGERVETLAELVHVLAEPLKGDILRQVLLECQSTQSMEAKAKGFSLLLPYLPESALEETLAAARTMTIGLDKARAIGRLAPHLPESMLREALAIVHTMQDLDHLGVYASALAGLAPYLSNELFQELHDEMRSWNHAIRAEVLAELVPCLPQPLQATIVAEAIMAAKWHASDFRKRELLLELLPSVPDALLPQVIDLAQTISSESDRVRVLINITPRLPASLLQEVRHIAHALKDADHKAAVLVEIAHHVSSSLQEQVLREALAVVGKQRSSTGDFGAPQHTTRQSDNFARLMSFLAQWSLDKLQPVWNEILSAQLTNTRHVLLATFHTLAPVMFRLGGKATMQATANAVHDAGRWWP